MLHSGILALVDKQTTDGSQSHLVEVTPPGSHLQCPHPRSLLPQGPAFPFPSLGLSSALSQGRGRLGRERGSQDAQASVLISTKAASLSGLGPAAFPRGTLLNSPLLRAKLASPWGDGGGEGRGGRGGGVSGVRGDGGRGARVKVAERERAEWGLNGWEGREEEKTGFAEPGSRSRSRGEGEGAGPETRRPPEQSAAGSRLAVVRVSLVSPESLDRVGRSAGPGGAVQAGETGLKGPIPGEVPVTRPAGIQLRPGGVGGQRARGPFPTPRSRFPRRLWLCSERPREPHLPPPGAYSTVEMQNTSLLLKIPLV